MKSTTSNAIKKKSPPKVLIILVIVIAIAIIGAIIGIQVYLPTVKYNKALEIMSSGHYEDAITAFSEISDKKDVSAEISECYYHLAEQSEQEESYKLAYDNYTRAGSYSDAQQKSYAMAELLFSSSLDEDNLAAANNWADCLDPNEVSSAKSYLNALKAESSDQIFDAIAAYKSLPQGYRDASSRMLNLCSVAYDDAVSTEGTSLLQAAELYEQFPDEFSDAQTRLDTLAPYLDLLGTYSLKLCANTDTALSYRNTDKDSTFTVDGYFKNGTFYITLPDVLSDGEKSRTVRTTLDGSDLYADYDTEATSSTHEYAYYVDGVWVLTQETDITYDNSDGSVGGGLLYLFTSGWNEFIGSTYYEAWAKENANYQYALTSLGLE